MNRDELIDRADKFWDEYDTSNGSPSIQMVMADFAAKIAEDAVREERSGFFLKLTELRNGMYKGTYDFGSATRDWMDKEFAKELER